MKLMYIYVMAHLKRYPDKDGNMDPNLVVLAEVPTSQGTRKIYGFNYLIDLYTMQKDNNGNTIPINREEAVLTVSDWVMPNPRTHGYEFCQLFTSRYGVAGNIPGNGQRYNYPRSTGCTFISLLRGTHRTYLAFVDEQERIFYTQEGLGFFMNSTDYSFFVYASANAGELNNSTPATKFTITPISDEPFTPTSDKPEQTPVTEPQANTPEQKPGKAKP